MNKKRQYESASEEEEDGNERFYDDDLNDSRSSDGCWDSDTDIEDPLAEGRSCDFEEQMTIHHDGDEIESDFNSDNDSDTDDESDFEDEDTDCDGDWSWDEAMEDPKEDQETVEWEDVKPTFVPRKQIPPSDDPEVFADKNSTPVELFLKVFPKGLIDWIVTCTNERLDIFAEKKGKEVPHTDSHEMILVLGIFLVMAYNRVPHMQMYWSQHPSLQNKAIKNAISRDRFLLLASKIYFNHPKKPKNADKTYYMNVLIKCLNTAFRRARAELSHQSIDETMVKFKGRSKMKQYMEKKKIKRGIKIFTRSCGRSGYCYDCFIYKGKAERKFKHTLGERVVRKLCKSLSRKDVVICMDRFFTSYELMKKSTFPLVGTCMVNRKNIPAKTTQKLQKGESVAKCTTDGVIAFKWQDTKEVTVLSNCHNSDISSVDRRQKDGSKKSVPCPEAIAFYNKYMGGVDMTDQYTVLYDVDRKSTKWWKRVFQRLLMTAVTNAWILFKHMKQKKVPLIDFMIPLAEDLMEIGKSGSKIQRTYKTGRPSKRSRNFVNVQHLPLPCTKRRCRHCANKNLEKRTKFVCSTCDVPLCAKCFFPYHQ